MMHQVRIGSARGCTARLAGCTRASSTLCQPLSRVPPRSRCRCAIRVHAVKFETVADAMTTGTIHTCTPDTPVEEALQMLVDKRITGLPVVSGEGKVVGVVSDFDLLALDSIGRLSKDKNLFPVADQTWQAFKDVKKLVAKSGQKRVGDVMTTELITCSPTDCLEDATRILLTKGIRRLPVLDESGRLVGIISRSNIVKAALLLRQASVSAAGSVDTA